MSRAVKGVGHIGVGLGLRRPIGVWFCNQTRRFGSGKTRIWEDLSRHWGRDLLRENTKIIPWKSERKGCCKGQKKWEIWEVFHPRLFCPIKKGAGDIYPYLIVIFYLIRINGINFVMKIQFVNNSIIPHAVPHLYLYAFYIKSTSHYSFSSCHSNTNSAVLLNSLIPPVFLLINFP